MSIRSFLCFFMFFLSLNAWSDGLKVIPLFQSCSVYFDGVSQAPKMEYRVAGDSKWGNAMPLVNSPNNKTWRASLLQLKEDTEYEVRVLDAKGTQLESRAFKTLGAVLPVASEKLITSSAPLKISERGSEKAWIRYRLPEQGIDGGMVDRAAILLENAEYIIIENAKVKGGKIYGIHIKNSRNIRILNCDVSGWGRPCVKRDKHRGVFIDEKKSSINFDGGIFIDGSSGVVVERCYIHDPRGTASSWLFDHPAGPCAIYMYGKGATVIRYNDLIGSDRHRWNDVIEGYYNGRPDGGFARDAEIYGNLMLLGNDDGMELDGGQMNIRVWGNQFEGSLCGISTAPCIYGPAYIWNNLFPRPGDEDGVVGSAFKHNYAVCGQGNIYLFHNTIVHKDGMSPFGKGKKPRRYLMTRNNVFDCEHNIFSISQIVEGCDFDYDLCWISEESLCERMIGLFKEYHHEKHGLVAAPRYIDAAAGDYRLEKDGPGYRLGTSVPGLEHFSDSPGIKGDIPLRPTALVVSRKHIDFDPAKKVAVEMSIMLGSGPPRNFRILKNAVSDYFEVRPSEGVLQPGQKQTLTVRLLRKDVGRRFKGAFLVKLDDGFSRPVTVYSGLDDEAIVKASTPGVAAFIEAENAGPGNPYAVRESNGRKALKLDGREDRKQDKSKHASYRFRVPEDGWYYLAVCFRPDGQRSLGSLFYNIDGGKYAMSYMRYSDGWCWAGLTDRSIRQHGWFRPVKLSKGEHTLNISAGADILLDAIAILYNPELIRRNR